MPRANLVRACLLIGCTALLACTGTTDDHTAGTSGAAGNAGSASAAGPTSTSGAGGSGGGSTAASTSSTGAAGTTASSTSGTGGAAAAGTTGTGGTGAGGAGGSAVTDGGTGGVKPVDGGADASETSGTADAGAGCAAPGTLCWDFEEGRLPTGWTAYRSEFGGSLLVDGTRPRKGTYSLHAKDFNGGVEGQQGGPKHTIRFDLPANFGPVLWGRAFVYTTPARPMSHAGLFNARYPRPNATSTAINALDWYEVATYMQKYMTIWHPPEPPGYPEWVQVADTPLVLDAWACLEWLFDGANGNGAQAADPRMWLNGVELAWPAPFVFSDPPTMTRPTQEKAQNFTVLETGVYLYQGLPTTTNWWIDDLAVGKQRIGCN